MYHFKNKKIHKYGGNLMELDIFYLYFSTVAKGVES